jgi:hypothetical protein
VKTGDGWKSAKSASVNFNVSGEYKVLMELSDDLPQELRLTLKELVPSLEKQ